MKWKKANLKLYLKLTGTIARNCGWQAAITAGATKIKMVARANKRVSKGQYTDFNDVSTADFQKN